jgi:hypothetical protein
MDGRLVTSGKRYGGHFKIFSLFSLLFSFFPCAGWAYVMPAEQIAGLMATNFFKCQTMVINQSVHLVNPRTISQEYEVIDLFEEKIDLKTPDLYHVELTGHQLGNISRDISWITTSRDVIFRKLFILSNVDSIMNFLAGIGVNVESVAFTRFNGSIAYRIGDNDPHSPSLLVEKEKFLPLFLSYCLPGDGKDVMVEVTFDDYRKTRNGWYPFEITYSKGGDIIEKYFVLELKINIPVHTPLLKKIPSTVCNNPSKKIIKNQADQEETHLREVLKTLERKHR